MVPQCPSRSDFSAAHISTCGPCNFNPVNKTGYVYSKITYKALKIWCHMSGPIQHLSVNHWQWQNMKVCTTLRGSIFIYLSRLVHKVQALFQLFFRLFVSWRECTDALPPSESLGWMYSCQSDKWATENIHMKMGKCFFFFGFLLVEHHKVLKVMSHNLSTLWFNCISVTL